MSVPGSGVTVAARRSPITTWTTLGRPGMSEVPAPNPDAVTVIAGIGPNDSASAVISATPVGVAISRWSSIPRAGAWARSSSAITAGAGFGSVPSAARIVP